MTTHPKFEDNNIKLWYSVMMYNFLAQTNKDLNWLGFSMMIDIDINLHIIAYYSSRRVLILLMHML